MSLILPKGIVVNSPGINGTIEQMNLEPLDPADIARFWKVYTTTKRRLLDPTAERLENYWWRIWGSRAQQLKGATVARLFAEISDGQAFVPLRGPANRDEGLSSSNTMQDPITAKSNAVTAPYVDRKDDMIDIALPSKAIAQPMSPHPILKKTRGPSTNGPRPTARFISPCESEEDSMQNTNRTNHFVAAGAQGSDIFDEAVMARTKNKSNHLVIQQPR